MQKEASPLCCKYPEVWRVNAGRGVPLMLQVPRDLEEGRVREGVPCLAVPKRLLEPGWRTLLGPAGAWREVRGFGVGRDHSAHHGEGKVR